MQKGFSRTLHLVFWRFLVLPFVFYFSSHKYGGFQHTENQRVLKRPFNNVEMVIFVWNKRSTHMLHAYNSIHQQQKLRNKILPEATTENTVSTTGKGFLVGQDLPDVCVCVCRCIHVYVSYNRNLWTEITV